MSYEFTKSYQECSINLTFSFLSSLQFNGISAKDVMQRKLFQKCTHLLYYSVLSLGGKVNTRRIHFSHKKSMKYSCRRKLLCELSKLSNLMLLTSSDTKRTLMHLLLFTNSAQRELVSICTQRIRNSN